MDTSQPSAETTQKFTKTKIIKFIGGTPTKPPAEQLTPLKRAMMRHNFVPTPDQAQKLLDKATSQQFLKVVSKPLPATNLPNAQDTSKHAAASDLPQKKGQKPSVVTFTPTKSSKKRPKKRSLNDTQDSIDFLMNSTELDGKPPHLPHSPSDHFTQSLNTYTFQPQSQRRHHEIADQRSQHQHEQNAAGKKAAGSDAYSPLDALESFGLPIQDDFNRHTHHNHDEGLRTIAKKAPLQPQPRSQSTQQMAAQFINHHNLPKSSQPTSHSQFSNPQTQNKLPQTQYQHKSNNASRGDRDEEHDALSSFNAISHQLPPQSSLPSTSNQHQPPPHPHSHSSSSQSTTARRKTMRKSYAANLLKEPQDSLDSDLIASQTITNMTNTGNQQRSRQTQQQLQQPQHHPNLSSNQYQTPTVSSSMQNNNPSLPPGLTFEDLLENGVDTENTMDIMNAIFNPHNIPLDMLERSSQTWAMLNSKELDLRPIEVQEQEQEQKSLALHKLEHKATQLQPQPLPTSIQSVLQGKSTTAKNVDLQQFQQHFDLPRSDRFLVANTKQTTQTSTQTSTQASTQISTRKSQHPTQRAPTQADQLKLDKISKKIANFTPDFESLKQIQTIPCANGISHSFEPQITNLVSSNENSQQSQSSQQSQTQLPQSQLAQRGNQPSTHTNNRRRKSVFMRAETLDTELEESSESFGPNPLKDPLQHFNPQSTQGQKNHQTTISSEPQSVAPKPTTVAAISPSNSFLSQLHQNQPITAPLPKVNPHLASSIPATVQRAQNVRSSSRKAPQTASANMNDDDSSDVEIIGYSSASTSTNHVQPSKPSGAVPKSAQHRKSVAQAYFLAQQSHQSTMSTPAQQSLNAADDFDQDSENTPDNEAEAISTLSNLINSFPSIDTTLNLYKFSQNQAQSAYPQPLSTFLPISTHLPPFLDLLTILLSSAPSLPPTINRQQCITTQQYQLNNSRPCNNPVDPTPHFQPKIWQLLFQSTLYSLTCLTPRTVLENTHAQMLSNSITELLVFLKQDTVSLIKKQQQTTSMTMPRDRFEHLNLPTTTKQQQQLFFPINPFLTLPLISHQHFIILNTVIAFLALLWEEQYRYLVSSGNWAKFHPTSHLSSQSATTYQPTMANMLLKTQFSTILTIFSAFSKTIFKSLQDLTSLHDATVPDLHPTSPLDQLFQIFSPTTTTATATANWINQPVHRLHKDFLALIESTFSSNNFLFTSDVNFAEPPPTYLPDYTNNNSSDLNHTSRSSLSSTNTTNTVVYSTSPLIHFLYQTINQTNAQFPKSFALPLDSPATATATAPTSTAPPPNVIPAPRGTDACLAIPKNPQPSKQTSSSNSSNPPKKAYPGYQPLVDEDDDGHSVCDTNSLLNLTFASSISSLHEDPFAHFNDELNCNRSSISSAHSDVNDGKTVKSSKKPLSTRAQRGTAKPPTRNSSGVMLMSEVPADNGPKKKRKSVPTAAITTNDGLDIDNHDNLDDEIPSKSTKRRRVSIGVGNDKKPTTSKAGSQKLDSTNSQQLVQLPPVVPFTTLPSKTTKMFINGSKVAQTGQSQPQSQSHSALPDESLKSKLKAQPNFPQTPIRKHRIQRGQITPQMPKNVKTIQSAVLTASPATSMASTRSTRSMTSNTSNSSSTISSKSVKSMMNSNLSTTAASSKLQLTTKSGRDGRTGMTKPGLAKPTSTNTASKSTSTQSFTKPSTSTASKPSTTTASTSSRILMRNGTNYSAYAAPSTSTSTASAKKIPGTKDIEKLSVSGNRCDFGIAKPSITASKTATMKANPASSSVATSSAKIRPISTLGAVPPGNGAQTGSKGHTSSSTTSTTAARAAPPPIPPQANITNNPPVGGRKTLKISDIRKLKF